MNMCCSYTNPRSTEATATQGGAGEQVAHLWVVSQPSLLRPASPRGAGKSDVKTGRGERHRMCCWAGLGVCATQGGAQGPPHRVSTSRLVPPGLPAHLSWVTSPLSRSEVLGWCPTFYLLLYLLLIMKYSQKAEE